MADKTLTDRLQPQAEDVEQRVLGAMLLSSEAVGLAIEILNESYFYKPAHQKIYSAIVALYMKGEPADIITVSNELSKGKQLEKVGGQLYINELATTVATAANVEYHAKIVLQKAVLRELISASADITSDCYDEMDDAEVLLDQAEQRIFEIKQKRIKSAFVPLKEILPHTFESFDDIKEGKIRGLPTGFHELDSLIGGFRPSDLVIVAGRPSIGKTTFALNIAEYLAVEEKVPVAIFSLETDRSLIGERMLCSRAKIDYSLLTSGSLKGSEWTKLSIAVGPLSEAKIFIDDTPGIRMMEMRAKARRLKAKEDIGLVIVDYLQLLPSPKRAESRQQEITMITRYLKELAKDLQVPVIALSQLSRRCEDRPFKKPELADLRESGAIEQDADIVFLIHRPEFYGIKSIPKEQKSKWKKTEEFGRPQKEEEEEKTEGLAWIIVAKHRRGKTGFRKLSFVADIARFENPDLMHTETPF